MDDYCRFKNRSFEVGQVIEPVQHLEKLIEESLALFEEKTFSRKFVPETEKFEGSFNRAIFDVLGGSLENQEFRKAALEDIDKFRSMYRTAFENSSFVRSVESTTKSISATKYRFTYWYERIEKEYGLALRVPLIKKND